MTQQKIPYQLIKDGTPLTLLGYDAAGNITVLPQSSFGGFDIDGLPAGGSISPTDLLALSIGGTESQITAQAFADSISSLLTTAISLKGIVSFTSSGTYNATAGTQAVMVIVTAAGGSQSGNGGSSSFGAFCSASGGRGNIGGDGNARGGGGQGFGGILNIDGGAGSGVDTGNSNFKRAPGGASFWGGGSVQLNTSTAPYGSGGGTNGDIGGEQVGAGAGGTSIDFITSGFDGTPVTIGTSPGSGTGGNGVCMIWEFG